MQVFELWFNDGTVVFQAEEKLFSLHGGFLSARSLVFRQILEDKNNDAAFHITRSIDISGRVLIQLPDTGQDTHNFFLAIYDVIPGFFEPPPSEVSTEVVLGILKMSTKYGVQSLRRRALAHLNTIYPLTLEEWDSRNIKGTILLQHEVYASFPYESTFASAYSILKTAKEAQAPWLLPAVLYNCCQYDLKDILPYFKQARQDGTADEDLYDSIIVGAYAHFDATRMIFKFLISPPADGCLNPAPCLEIRRSCMENITSLFPNNNPLGIWDDSDWDVYFDGMCKPCMDICWGIHHEERNSFWDELPQIYGQNEDWSVLKDLYSKEMLL